MLEMGFAEDELALERRFLDLCGHPGRPLPISEDAEGKVIGYAALHDDGPHLRSGESRRTARLEDLYTVPAWRRGVARQLMGAVEAWARARPLRDVFWFANTHQAGPAYQRMGYRPDTAGQDGFLFFELDLGRPADRRPHPERGS